MNFISRSKVGQIVWYCPPLYTPFWDGSAAYPAVISRHNPADGMADLYVFFTLDDVAPLTDVPCSIAIPSPGMWTPELDEDDVTDLARIHEFAALVKRHQRNSHAANLELFHTWLESED